MKILIIASKSRSLVNFRGPLLREIINRGHQVHTVAPDYEREVDEKLNKWGVKYHIAFIERTGTSVLSDLKTLFSVKSIIRKIQPDLVLSYTIKPVIYGSIAAHQCGITKIYSMITGLGSVFNNKMGFKGKLLNFVTTTLYKFAVRKNTGIIFQNPDDREVFIHKKLVKPEKAYRVYGSGVDLNWFTFAEPHLNPLTFLFIGRMMPEKGIDDFISAARAVQEKYPNTRFYVLGRFDDNPNAIDPAKIEKWQNEELIKYFGEVKDVRPYLEEASVFVLPSYYGEGTPRTALEALAMGRPVITTNSVGCKETVNHDVNGFIVPPKDPNAIAEAMQAFANNPDLIRSMGLEGRKLAEEYFDVNKVNKQILSILNI